MTPVRILVCAALLALALTGCARTGGDAFQATHTDALRFGDAGLGQTFTPGADRLAGVDVLVVTYGEPPDADADLVLELIDRADDAVVAAGTLPGEAVEDNRWVSLRFDEPAEVPDGEPAVRVRWTGESPMGLRANVPPGDADPDERLLNDPYGGGQLLRDDEAAAGDLAFRLVGDPGPAEPLLALGRLAAGALRALAAAPLAAAVWALALAGSVALAVWGLRRGS